MKKFLMFTILAVLTFSCSTKNEQLTSKAQVMEKMRAIAKKHGAIEGIHYNINEEQLIPENYDFESFEQHIISFIHSTKMNDAYHNKNKALNKKMEEEILEAKTVEEQKIIVKKYEKSFAKLEREFKQEAELKKK
jgi:hypothetical protein